MSYTVSSNNTEAAAELTDLFDSGLGVLCPYRKDKTLTSVHDIRPRSCGRLTASYPNMPAPY